MNAELREKLAKLSHPIQGFELDNDHSDMEPLREMVKGARIVALGEASHGTREHFQFKNRVIRFLVEEMGFHHFVIEASQWECKNIDDYVMMGKGEKYAALSSQRFWTWDTEEVMELIDWMRAHNLNCERGQECHFLGFDMQIIPNVLKHLEKLGELIPEDSKERFSQAMEAVLKTERGKKYPELEAFAYWLHGWVGANEDLLKEKYGFQGAELFEEASRTLVQFIDMTQQADGNTSRDKSMAENIARLVDGLDPSEKVILWAHDGHISKRFQWVTMGQLLAERYGSQYYALGYGMWGGQFQSRLTDLDQMKVGPLQSFDIPEFPDYCWEADLRQVNEKDYYLDLRTAMQDAEIRAWAEQDKPMIMLDEAWDPNKGVKQYESPMVLANCFDGMVFTHQTHAAISNPSGKRG